MTKKGILISILIACLSFASGWFAKDFNQFAEGVLEDAERPGLGKDSIIQLVSDDALAREQVVYDSSRLASAIQGRFVLKGSHSAGFDFVSPTTVLWTNERFPFEADTLKIRWINDSTFLTRSTDRWNEQCPPIVSVYQVIFYDGHKLVLNDIWTGWNEFDDDVEEFYKK